MNELKLKIEELRNRLISNKLDKSVLVFNEIITEFEDYIIYLEEINEELLFENNYLLNK